MSGIMSPKPAPSLRRRPCMASLRNTHAVSRPAGAGDTQHIVPQAAPAASAEHLLGVLRVLHTHTDSSAHHTGAHWTIRGMPAAGPPSGRLGALAGPPPCHLPSQLIAWPLARGQHPCLVPLWAAARVAWEDRAQTAPQALRVELEELGRGAGRFGLWSGAWLCGLAGLAARPVSPRALLLA